MKKILMCAALCFVVCNVSAQIIVSASDETLTVKSFTQYKGGETSYDINPSINSGELAYTVVRLRNAASVAGKRYSYILWTEKPLSNGQAQQLISYVASHASGNLSSVAYTSTLLASGADYTWYAAGGSRDYMSFARKSFYQSNSALLLSMAAGAYTASGTAATTLLTLPVTTTAAQTTTQQSAQTTTAAPALPVTTTSEHTQTTAASGDRPINTVTIPECGS